MKTIRKENVTVEYVEYLPYPSKMEKNVMYICESNNHATHLCLGCHSTHVTVPMNEPNGWRFVYDNDKLTVIGSFLNQSCKCHYIISKNVANIV